MERGKTLNNKQTLHCPAGNSAYARAKYYQVLAKLASLLSLHEQSKLIPVKYISQVVEKNPKAAILWFWKAINAGDRVDSALKDMAVTMNQTGRTEEAIEAIKSFRHLCSEQSQQPLDNLLIDLYKKCGQIDNQIQLYKQKLHAIYIGKAFNGKAIKTSRSHGKKIHVSIQQEMARILGNIGWAHMQQGKYEAAEVVYRKAQQINPNESVARSLGYCLMKMGRFEESYQVLSEVVSQKIFEELVLAVDQGEGFMRELEELTLEFDGVSNLDMEEEIVERLELLISD